ncbi:MAG: hypothetical protein ACTTKH_04025 [Treponema sp.]
MKKCCLLFFCLLAFNLHASVVLDDLAGAVRTFWTDSNGLPSNTILDIICGLPLMMDLFALMV